MPKLAGSVPISANFTYLASLADIVRTTVCSGSGGLMTSTLATLGRIHDVDSPVGLLKFDFHGLATLVQVLLHLSQHSIAVVSPGVCRESDFALGSFTCGLVRHLTECHVTRTV